ncbi:MAG: ketopantoate reductase family protein [Acidobacteriia bacterium]|nr:ketopantoate reductase family protein [Terriglobia bacterium]
MRIAVMATGGLGGYYGALLAKNGHDVVFIARGAHLIAMRENGLAVRSVHGDLSIRPVQVTDDPRTIGPVDWVLFTVKTYDTEAAARAIQPILADDTAVVTFQNGVEAHEQIGAIIGMEHVLVAPVQIVSNAVAPGVIEQRSQFRLMTIGEACGGVTPRVRRLVAEFRDAGMEASATADVLTPLWHKFVFIASIAGLSSLARTEPYELLQLAEARATLHAAMEEVHATGEALGVRMDADIVERQYQFCLRLGPGQKASMHLDLEQGKRLEIDAMSGAIVRLGAVQGVPTPVHRTIYAGLKMMDERARRKTADAPGSR